MLEDVNIGGNLDYGKKCSAEIEHMHMCSFVRIYWGCMPLPTI